MRALAAVVLASLLIMGCSQAERDRVMEALRDIDRGVMALEAVQQMAASDSLLVPIADSLESAFSDFEEALSDLLPDVAIQRERGRGFRPATLEDAVKVAALLGLDESCANRCWDCPSGTEACGAGCQVCGFFSCLPNCGHHHPVCCYGCSEPNEPNCPGNVDGPTCTERGAALQARLDSLGIEVELVDGFPASDAEAEAIAVALGIGLDTVVVDGVGESKWKRCAHCGPSTCCSVHADCSYCDFLSCLDNSDWGYHPICCWDC